MLLMALFLVIILAVLIYRPIWGIYALVWTVFFSSGWMIYFSGYEWARGLPWIAALDAPVADFIGLVLLVATVTLLIFTRVPNLKAIKKTLHPAVWFYLAFLCVSAISVAFAYDHNTAESLRYFLRFYLFPFISFWLLPIFLIREPKQLLKVLNIWFGVGIVVSLYGLSSLFFATQSGWLRVTPYSLFGFAPLGFNHNQIAEVLVAIAPIAVFLSRVFPHKRKMYMWGASLIVSTALLTFSRAAWLTLILQAIVGGYIYKEKTKEWIHKRAGWFVFGAAMIACVSGLMFIFLQSGTVQSSTTARLETTRAVMFYFEKSPFIGYGPGMYLRLVGTTWALVQEFGEPLDAHGIVQKLLAETGLVGVILISSFFGICLFKIFKAEKNSFGFDKYLFTTMLLSAGGAVFFQLFNTSYFSGVMWMPIGVSMSAIMMKHKENI